GKDLQPLVLEDVGVLELVDQDVRKAASIVLAQAVVARQELVSAQQELGKIDDALAIAGLLVEGVVLDLAPAEIVVGLDLVRTQARLLGAVDERLQGADGKPVVIDV